MTEILPVSPESVKYASELIREGKVVAFPTETVYGLGADAGNPDAIAAIFEAKGRPQDNPLIAHIWDVSMLPGVISGELPPWAKTLADRFWPGPLTMILPKGDRVCLECTAHLDSVGVRLPENIWARELIKQSGVPIAAPSANTSGRPSPTTARHVYDDMKGRIPLILDGGEAKVGVESTVIDARAFPVRILRPGGITREMILGALGDVEVDAGVMRPLAKNEVARSPGMKYRHYAPKGSLTIVEGEETAAAGRIIELYDAFEGEKRVFAMEAHLPLYGGRNVVSLGKDKKEAAHRLFALLREMDDLGVQAIFSEAVDETDIGLAVMNRMGRAAAFNIIKV
ncbi:MAG: threonylcarbamoyl-AMP synthase [Clostridia bacterium]|nr:threonylcarbamoyl-AMP synthase [Clostridia bacterium]MCR4577769.1 threonylcarbamoyl-AMP synthase [Clostridiales bacterium]